MVSPVISVGAPFIGMLSVSGLRTAKANKKNDSSINAIARSLFVIVRIFVLVKVFCFLVLAISCTGCTGKMHLFGKSTAKKPTSSPADAIFKLSEQENVAMLLFYLYF
jgi:hypothetical protein